MTRHFIRRLALGLLAAPLAFGLAACADKSDGSAGPSGDPIEKVAPPTGKSWTEVIEKTPEGGYRMGNPEAPIKLIEFASLTCPHCKNFGEEAGPELRDKFVASGRVSWEFRNFILNPLDLTMTMAVRCGSPESFFALVDQTFQNQEAIVEAYQKATPAQLEQASNLRPSQRYQALASLAGLQTFYGARGIAADQANACLADGASAEALAKASSEQGEKYDVKGTPAFVINGSTLDINAWPEIRTRLENLGAR